MARTLSQVIARSTALSRDEAELVAAAARDPAAFEALYKHYAERVYRYLRARVEDAEEAADLTQQVFLQALAALPRYRARGLPFAAWLFRIARNMTIDAQRRKRPVVRWEWQQGLDQVDIDHDLETEVVRREAVARLHVLLAQLDAAQREVVLLRFMAELTVREIAAMVGRSEATIYRQLSRALRTLKEAYGDEG